MKDKKGFLPAHVACSRHCSPEKLKMLLSVYPVCLFEKTNDGHTLISLATCSATKSHPNYALIDELNRQMELAACGSLVSEESDYASRGRLDSNDSEKSKSSIKAFFAFNGDLSQSRNFLPGAF